MTARSVEAVGTINKAWAAAIAAPLGDWLVGILADSLWNGPRIAMPDSAQMALVSLIVGLVVYRVPNLRPDTPGHLPEDSARGRSV